MDVFICDGCKGFGFNENHLCMKCYGTGELTWLEIIFGKPPEFYNEQIHLKAEQIAHKYKLAILDNVTLKDIENELNEYFKDFKFKLVCSFSSGTSIDVKFLPKGY